MSVLLSFLPIPYTESAWHMRRAAYARVRIPYPKVDKLACQAQGVGIFVEDEIPVFIKF